MACSFPFFAQNTKLDSLRSALKASLHDTITIKIYQEMGELTYLNDSEKSLTNWKKGILLAEKAMKKYKQGSEELNAVNRMYCSLLTNCGVVITNQGNTELGIKTYTKSLKFAEQNNLKTMIAVLSNNLGFSYKAKGNIPLALSYYERSLSIKEELKDQKGQAVTLNNIGVILLLQGDEKKALEYYYRSLKLRETMKDQSGIAQALNNIAFVYYERGTKENRFKNDSSIDQGILKALQLYNKSLKIRKEIKDRRGEAESLINIGLVYKNYSHLLFTTDLTKAEQTGLNKAIELYSEALSIQKEIGDKRGQAQNYTNISSLYLQQKKYKEARIFAEEGLKIGRQLGFPENIKASSLKLYEIYKVTNKHDLALQNYEVYIAMRDSIQNEKNRKATIKSQLKYEYEKQAAADSVAHAKESEIKNAELAKQSAEIKAKKNQQYALFGGLGLVMIFAGFMYNRFKVTQKQKGIIVRQKEVVEEQKKLVEEKQKEILDSIQYAKRIQLAQIPSEKQISKFLDRLKR